MSRTRPPIPGPGQGVVNEDSVESVILTFREQGEEWLMDRLLETQTLARNHVPAFADCAKVEELFKGELGIQVFRQVDVVLQGTPEILVKTGRCA